MFKQYLIRRRVEDQKKGKFIYFYWTGSRWVHDRDAAKLYRDRKVVGERILRFVEEERIPGKDIELTIY